MSGNHKSTSNHNREVLTKDLGLNQQKNSSVFENEDFFVLSPSVQNKINWFDLRKINLDKKPEKKKGLLIIRLFDKFILIDLKKISNDLLDDEPYETKNSGIHWKFHIRTDKKGQSYILNMRSKKRFDVKKIDKDELLSTAKHYYK